MSSLTHPSSQCNSSPPIPLFLDTSRPAANNLTAASQQRTACKVHASHQLIRATRDRPDSLISAQPVVRPLTQAPIPRWSAVTHQYKAQGTGHDHRPGLGAARSPATGWSEVVPLDLLPSCIQLLSQGQVTKALDLLQQLTSQHGPPDRDVGDTFLLVRPSSQTC